MSELEKNKEDRGRKKSRRNCYSRTLHLIVHYYFIIYTILVLYKLGSWFQLLNFACRIGCFDFCSHFTFYFYACTLHPQFIRAIGTFHFALHEFILCHKYNKPKLFPEVCMRVLVGFYSYVLLATNIEEKLPTRQQLEHP